MSWSLLERFFQSELFNNDPSLAVAYLSRYANHVGIQYVLCHKLRQFAYEEIEFFLPQLCHLLVSVDELVSVEEFILDLCQESVSGALLTFWLFQTHLHDLSGNPQSTSFKTCRRIFMKVQSIVFGTSESIRPDKIRENILPTTVLASIVLAGVAAPFLPRELGALAVTHARKPQPTEETISEAPQVQQRSGRSHTISGAAERLERPPSHSRSESEAPGPAQASSEGRPRSARHSVKPRPNHNRPGVRPAPKQPNAVLNGSIPPLSTSPRPESQRARIAAARTSETTRPVSMVGRLPQDTSRPSSGTLEAAGLASLSKQEKIHMLRSNYFDNEIRFLTALEGISNRLVVVPKPARLSALRAELALVASDLPAEVDIPLICPATLDDGSPSRSRHHRVVRINPAEATSLNSAERVPYLLIIEVLREDFDFNPQTEANQRLLGALLSEKESGKRRLFDITAAARASAAEQSPVGNDSVFEPATGDLSSPTLLKDLTDGPQRVELINLKEAQDSSLGSQQPRNSSGTQTMSSYSMLSTPRTSENSRASSPAPRKTMAPANNRPQGPDQPDFSALATHMRTAAQMLAQLELSGSKRPRHEVDAIKGKIIASMQSLEEQNFYNEDPSNTATFDTIMAQVRKDSDAGGPTDFDDDSERSPESDAGGAGAARMENDQKIGGVQRKGDRDDPSAAMFGEEWKSKKERIRRSSPYGWMKNWDLLSVIVKTGSDLRQEMFACQLIRICAKIWEDAGVPVWLKQMKILVTGESSGLIETIANGVSLHSLKRSLTLSTIASGANPRKRFATLRDHFIRAFGEVDSPGYKAASDAFMRSLAAYSMISYILQLKDRHNGNLLIDNVGHIIHIDFGFMLSNSPGSVGFEAAPFKLTQEFVDVLGGVTGADFEGYKSLCKQAFQALRKSAENIVSVVEMMAKESKMACFASGGAAYATSSLRQRFCLQLSQEEAEHFVDELITKSLGSYYTRLYDTFQYRTQGIY